MDVLCGILRVLKAAESGQVAMGSPVSQGPEGWSWVVVGWRCRKTSWIGKKTIDWFKKAPKTHVQKMLPNVGFDMREGLFLVAVSVFFGF